MRRNFHKGYGPGTVASFRSSPPYNCICREHAIRRRRSDVRNHAPPSTPRIRVDIYVDAPRKILSAMKNSTFHLSHGPGPACRSALIYLYRPFNRPSNKFDGRLKNLKGLKNRVWLEAAGNDSRSFLVFVF